MTRPYTVSIRSTPAESGYWVYPKNRPAYFRRHNAKKNAVSKVKFGELLAGAAVVVVGYFGLIIWLAV